MKNDWPIIDTTGMNKDALLEFAQNEKIIKRLLRVPKKRRTEEQIDELHYRVWNRVNIIRRFNEK